MRQTVTQPRIIHHRPLEELADSLQESWKSVCECTAKFLRKVYEFDLRQGYKEWGFSDTAEWLDFKCGISRVTARDKVRVARCLVVLSKVEKAFAEGKLSYSKVRALTRVAKLETEDELLDFALKCPASFLEKRLGELRNGSVSGTSDGAHMERRLWSCEREGDQVEIKVNLTKEDAGVVLAALERCKHEIAESGLQHDGKWDDLALSADALVLMARRSMAGRFNGDGSDQEHGEAEVGSDSAESSASAHLVMVHVDESALRGNGGASDLPIKTVKRLLCDGSAVGIIENGDGEPLSIRRRSRTVPTGMRRALDARDRTCRFPGCSHTRWLDAHHIRHWTDGGETNLDNLVLLCTHHHRLLHEGGFQMLERDEGGYYFAKRDGHPVELGPGQTLQEGEETWALRPWGENKECLRDSAEAIFQDSAGGTVLGMHWQHRHLQTLKDHGACPRVPAPSRGSAPPQLPGAQTLSGSRVGE